MRRIFFLLIITLSSIQVRGQVIEGQLLDSLESIPLEYATVALYQKSDSSLVAGVVTDENGSFQFRNLSKSTYYLIAQFMGYEAHSIDNINLNKKATIELSTIFLSPNQQLLKEINVEGDKFTAIHKVDRQVFEAEKYDVSQGGTATDVLRNLPSITVNGQGEISFRGSTGFMVLINGKPIQSQPEVMLNQLPANSIQNIELITAPSAKYDPEGKSGIINIVTKKGATDGLFIQTNLKIGLPSIEDYDNAENAQRYGGDFILNYNKNKWDVSFGLSYLRNDKSGRREGDVFTIINDTLTQFPSDGERSFDETNYSGRFNLGFEPNDHDRFDLGFFAGKRSKDRTADILYFDNRQSLQGTELHNIQYFNENLRIRKGDFVLGSLDYSHKFKNQSSVSTSLLYEYTLLGGPTTNRNLDWPNTSLILQDEFNTNDNPLNGVRLQIDYASAPLKFGQIEAGLQFRNLSHTGDFVYERNNNETGLFELVPAFSSEVDLKRQIHSTYAQLSGEKQKWNYGIGLRMEYMDRQLDLKDKTGALDTTFRYDFFKPFPTANLQYRANENLTIKAAYSRRIQRTTTFKMNPFPEREHSETLEQGDPELLPEFIDLIELGLVKDIGESSVYATAYFRNVNNLVNRVNTVFNDSILNRIYSNVGNGRSVGVEFGADVKITKWLKTFTGANLYQRSIEGTFDDRSVNTSNFIWSINSNITFELPKKLSIQGAVNYISARNTAQGEDSRYLSPNLTVKKALSDRCSLTLQWLNIDLGLLDTNEQRITTARAGEFFTTTNYVYEVDMIVLNFSYYLKKSNNEAKFIKSEFGAKEF